MAKRYYQNKKDKRKESSGMKKYRSKEMYAGKEMRYHMEYDDSMMIREDHSQIANLPQSVSIKAYPKSPAYNESYVPDTIRGVDNQMREDSMHGKMEKFPEKY